jgi:hypothetical protein
MVETNLEKRDIFKTGLDQTFGHVVISGEGDMTGAHSILKIVVEHILDPQLCRFMGGRSNYYHINEGDFLQWSLNYYPHPPLIPKHLRMWHEPGFPRAYQSTLSPSTKYSPFLEKIPTTKSLPSELDEKKLVSLIEVHAGDPLGGLWFKEAYTTFVYTNNILAGLRQFSKFLMGDCPGYRIDPTTGRDNLGMVFQEADEPVFHGRDSFLEKILKLTKERTSLLKQ